MRKRITHRERTTERLAENRHWPALRRRGRDHPMQIVDKLRHPLRLVTQPQRGHGETTLEARHLPVKQSRPIEAGDKDQRIAHGFPYGSVSAVTPAQTGRVVWTMVSIVAVESFVFGLSVLPAFLFWTWTLRWDILDFPLLRQVIVATTLVPAYLIFAISFARLSALSTSVFG